MPHKKGETIYDWSVIQPLMKEYYPKGSVIETQAIIKKKIGVEVNLGTLRRRATIMGLKVDAEIRSNKARAKSLAVYKKRQQEAKDEKRKEKRVGVRIPDKMSYEEALFLCRMPSRGRQTRENYIDTWPN